MEDLFAELEAAKKLHAAIVDMGVIDLRARGEDKPEDWAGVLSLASSLGFADAGEAVRALELMAMAADAENRALWEHLSDVRAQRGLPGNELGEYESPYDQYMEWKANRQA